MLGLFLRYALPALVLTGAVSFGVHKYNDGIREKAVAAALVKERAVTTPAFNALTQQFKTIEKNIIESRKAAKEKADAAITKEQDRADKATEDYKRELRAKKLLAAERDRLVVALDEQRASRLPELTQPLAARDGDSAEVGRLRVFADGLGRLLSQCQQTAADIRRAAATAIDRVAAAEAAARALKPD